MGSDSTHGFLKTRAVHDQITLDIDNLSADGRELEPLVQPVLFSEMLPIQTDLVVTREMSWESEVTT